MAVRSGREQSGVEADRPPKRSISGGSRTRQTMKTLRRWLPTVLLLKLFIPDGGEGE
jgi:hypothetical protein